MGCALAAQEESQTYEDLPGAYHFDAGAITVHKDLWYQAVPGCQGYFMRKRLLPILPAHRQVSYTHQPCD